MCARCDDLQAEIDYLRGELGLAAREQDVHSIKRAFRMSDGQCRVLLQLYGAAGRPLSREQVEEAIPNRRGLDRESNKIVDVYVCKVRAALPPGSIETVWGFGYRMTATGLDAVRRVLAPRQSAALAPSRSGRVAA